MSFHVYILYSPTLNQYYIGHTENLRDRIFRHTNSGSKSTKKVSDWAVKYTEQFELRQEAMQREVEIKKKKSRIKKGYNAYDGRMKAMLLIALFPLVVLAAQPLGYISFWIPVILICIGASAHQAWSANIFTTVSDMFPKKAVGSVVGIGGMAGGLGGY